jgi:hypothetical protein
MPILTTTPLAFFDLILDEVRQVVSEGLVLHIFSFPPLPKRGSCAITENGLDRCSLLLFQIKYLVRILNSARHVKM